MKAALALSLAATAVLADPVIDNARRDPVPSAVTQNLKGGSGGGGGSSGGSSGDSDSGSSGGGVSVHVPTESRAGTLVPAVGAVAVVAMVVAMV